MPLFGFRKDKKHEQSHIQAEAGLAKAATPRAKKSQRAAKSAKPEKISREVLTKDAGAAKTGPALPKGHFSGKTDVIIRPRITEKSGILSQNGVYTFEVTKSANKQAIARAIAELYKVTPVKLAVINTPIKNVFVKNRRGQVAGIRKAVVTVKKGDKIDFV